MRYQYQKAKDVTMKIRRIGTVTQRAFKKGINSKETAFVIQNNTIYTCPPGCSYCIHPNICEACFPGFTLDDNGICIKCGLNCYACVITRPQACTSCVDGFFYNFSKSLCQQCKSTCLTCSSNSGNCSACKTGFYLYNVSCFSCIDNCLSCR